MFKISTLWRMAVILFEGFARHLARFPYQAARKLLVVSAAVAFATHGLLPDIAIAGASPAASPALLKSSTIEAFHLYVRLTDRRSDDELKRGTGLLWIDALPETERTQAYGELQHGAVKMRKLETLENGAAIRCPDGMIHHWVGLAFISGAKLADVLTVLEDYNQHAVYY